MIDTLCKKTAEESEYEQAIAKVERLARVHRFEEALQVLKPLFENRYDDLPLLEEIIKISSEEYKNVPLWLYHDTSSYKTASYAWKNMVCLGALTDRMREYNNRVTKHFIKTKRTESIMELTITSLLCLICTILLLIFLSLQKYIVTAIAGIIAISILTLYIEKKKLDFIIKNAETPFDLFLKH